MSLFLHINKSPWVSFFTPLIPVVLLLTGCGPSSDSKSSKAETGTNAAPMVSGVLNILVIDSPDIAPVMVRQYVARNSGTVIATEASWADLKSKEFAQIKQSDVVIYPAMRLGDLIESGLISNLEAGDLRGDESRRSVLTFDRDHIASWKDKCIGVSMGQLSPVLLVRRDVLKKCEKEFPATWEEFSAIRQWLADNETEDHIPSKIAVPLANHWASYMLMARTASSIRTRGRYSSFFDVGDMQPLIESEPYLRALQGWSADLKGESEVETLAPEKVLQQFLDGDLAMAITVVHPKMLAGEMTPEFEFDIGSVPGSQEVFDFDSRNWSPRPAERPSLIPLVGCRGLVASVSASTERSRVAADFLSWLQDKQISAIIGLESADIGPSQKTHLASPGKWLGSSFSADNATQYARCIQAANEERICLVALRVPSADMYLDSLDDAVRAAINGKSNPVEALAQVQLHWSKLNDEIGLEKQREAYRASEGISN